MRSGEGHSMVLSPCTDCIATGLWNAEVVQNVAHTARGCFVLSDVL